tara:strand:+ start:868 stop:1275 length:408 start_codon:yes stop_codon:yes gene_type:complete
MKIRGFTIIELLIVMAIIGMLASVVLAVFSGMQTKSRDTRRMEDMQQLRNALGLYYIDNNRYPVVGSATNLTGSDSVSTALKASGALSGAVVDPVSPTYDYVYETTGVATYQITFCLETNSIPNYVQGCTNTVSQ